MIEKGKVALVQPGKGVSLWTTKYNCPFCSGPEARAGRENFLPERLLPAKGGMKCHTNYLGSGQCEENWLQLCEAAARAPITEWGWGGFSVLLYSAVILLTAEPSTHRVTRCGCSTVGSELQWGWTKVFGPKSALAFTTQSHFGGIQDQSPWRRWNCTSAADICTAMELEVMPGCTQSCALLQCCFGGGRAKSCSAHQECLNKKGILTISQQNSIWQKVQLNAKYNRLLFYQEIKSFVEKKIQFLGRTRSVSFWCFISKLYTFLVHEKKLHCDTVN